MSSMQVVKQREVIATLHNHTFDKAYCHRHYNWSGYPIQAYPPPVPVYPPIAPNGVAKFVEFGPKGIKGAVVYEVQKNESGQVSWILAWDAPEHLIGSRNKVYVKCGYKSEIDKVTEEQILEGLEKSSEKDEDFDRASKAFATAKIVSDKDISEKFDLTASFGRSMN